MPSEVKLQYLSNSGFLLTTEEGKRIIIDPYLKGNPAAPFGPEKIPPVDLVVVTHAAFDHLGDSFYLAKRDQAPLVGDYLVRQLALADGLPKEQIKSCSYGGTVEKAGIRLRVLMAHHTSNVLNRSGDPLTGIPLAFLITTPGGLRICARKKASPKGSWAFSPEQPLGPSYRGRMENSNQQGIKKPRLWRLGRLRSGMLRRCLRKRLEISRK